ncbi:heterokaryon incompatibility protein-domain-containing protein [Podospora didyma]|uniref:Heterokaryon incompatibility protein-domain-containing protein n=1 Tax=Podospora didyma TaxID=330526 RepID=A0AAE0NPU7_9PEZI|nr:heterokaryon incompatibility protein-domain-containing protein [Podospora didyma]
MRLINTSTLELQQFFEPNIPPYAILSHTWGRDEISLQEFLTAHLADSSQEVQRIDPPLIRAKMGYAKVIAACRAAQGHFDYLWVDTCCIDKTNPAELSESINSMFKWYQNSAMCYAYLGDLDGPNSRGRNYDNEEQDFSECNWFTRGWTLQELIASPRLEFYDRSWNCFGTKRLLQPTLARITNIDEAVLGDANLRHTIPVGKRLSWASKRKTERIEDRAYSLLGIFDVNMPMLYGEGNRAFLRLQQEIFAQNQDLSIFSWNVGANQHPYLSMFAPSPEDFANCSGLRLSDMFIGSCPLSSSALRFNKAVIELGYVPLHTWSAEGSEANFYSLRLPHQNSAESRINEIFLRKVGPGLFVRIPQPSSTHTRFWKPVYTVQCSLDAWSPPSWTVIQDVRLSLRVREAVGYDHEEETLDNVRIMTAPHNTISASLDSCYDWSIHMDAGPPSIIHHAEPSDFWCRANSCFLLHSQNDFIGCIRVITLLKDPSTATTYTGYPFHVTVRVRRRRTPMGQMGLIPEFSFDKSFASTRHLDALLGDAKPLSVVPSRAHNERELLGVRTESVGFHDNGKVFQKQMQVSLKWDQILWCGTLVFSTKININFVNIAV